MSKLMNFNEAKVYLKTSRATLYRLIQEGKVPASKFGGQWRFNKERLDKWLDDHENIKTKIGESSHEQQ